MTGSLEHGFLDLNKSLTGHRTGIDEALFACIVYLAPGTKYGIISANGHAVFAVHDILEHEVIEDIEDRHLVPLQPDLVDRILGGHDAVELEADLTPVDHIVVRSGLEGHLLGARRLAYNLGVVDGEVCVFRVTQFLIGKLSQRGDLAANAVFTDFCAEEVVDAQLRSLDQVPVARQKLGQDIFRNSSKFCLIVCHVSYPPL